MVGCMQSTSLQGASSHSGRNVDPCRQSDRSPEHRFLFAMGDVAFVAAVGAQAALVMHTMHDLGLAFVWASILGMAAAMAIQMLMAFVVAPLLGSIESMTPSMVVAMVVPMLLDVVELAGWRPDMRVSAQLGAGFGVSYAAYLMFYGARCRRRFSALVGRGVCP